MRGRAGRGKLVLGVALVLLGVAGIAPTFVGAMRQGRNTAAIVAPRATAQPTVPPVNPPTPTHNAQVARQLTPTPMLMAAGVPSGSQLVERTFFSLTLGREMPYFVYLPVGYAESDKRYPVLYMLHGRGEPGIGGSDTEWVAYGLPETADRMMNAGEIQQMILVMPQGDQSYWMNHAGGSRWGDYTAKDVVAHMDATYRTIPDAAHRAVGGLSMGGHGSIQLAINHPGVFGSVGMHSGTLRTFEERLDYFGDRAHFATIDPASLVRQYPDRARALRIFMDVGQQDAQWGKQVGAFHNLLSSLGVPHAFESWQGEHNAFYWGPHIPDYLRFYNAGFPPS